MSWKRFKLEAVVFRLDPYVSMSEWVVMSYLLHAGIATLLDNYTVDEVVDVASTYIRALNQRLGVNISFGG